MKKKNTKSKHKVYIYPKEKEIAVTITLPFWAKGFKIRVYRKYEKIKGG